MSLKPIEAFIVFSIPKASQDQQVPAESYIRCLALEHINLENAEAVKETKVKLLRCE